MERWIDLLAEGKFTEAIARTAADPHHNWTAQLLEAVIAGYGLPEPHPSGKNFKVTRRAQAQSGPPRRTVERALVPAGALAYVEHDLPLNDRWSDLTASFLVKPSNKGSVLVLQEVHVF